MLHRIQTSLHVLLVSPSGGEPAVAEALGAPGFTFTQWSPGSGADPDTIGDVTVLDLSGVDGPESRGRARAMMSQVAHFTIPLRAHVVIAHPGRPTDDVITSTATSPCVYVSPDDVRDNLTHVLKAVYEAAHLADDHELLDATGYARFATDAVGNTIETSEAELRLLGYDDPSEILGKPRGETIWLSLEKRRSFLGELLTRGRIDDYIALFKKKGGRELIWVRGDCRVIRGPSNKAVQIRGVYRDITHAHAEAMYHTALSLMARQRSAAAQIPKIVCEAVLETAVARLVLFLTHEPWNDVLILQHIDGEGLSPGLRGRLEGSYFSAPANRLQPAALPEGLSLELGEELLVRPLGTAAEPQAYVWIVGRYAPAQTTMRRELLDEFLEASALCLQTAVALQINRLHRAIHEVSRAEADPRNRAERFLAHLLEAVQREVPFEGGSIFRKAPMGDLLYLAATTGLHGSPRKADVYYEMGTGLTGQVGANKQRMVLLDVDKAHTPRFYEEIKGPGRSWVGVPILAPGGALVGVLRALNRHHRAGSPIISPFTPWDVEILGAAAEHAEIILSLLNAEEQRTQLLARVTHEIRAPANAIRASLDVLRRRRADEERFLLKCDDLELNAAVLLDLALTLDGLYGPPRGQLGDEEPVPLRSVLEAVIHVMKADFRVKRIDVVSSIHIPPGLPRIRMKRTALTQICFNLFQNALRYAANPAEDFLVEIDCKVTPRRTFVHFRDHGMGVLAGDRHRIFEPGVRGINAHLASTRGTGLGLAICRQIMGDYGGTIALTRLAGPTEFTLTFPAPRVLPS